MNKKRTPSSQRWLKAHHSDPYVKQARIDGYRSRAAYKLLEIHKKESLLKPGMTVIDLGAAPGSWSEIATQQVGPRGQVIAVDLLPMKPINGMVFLQGDFEEAQTWHQIHAATHGKPIDVVLSDMAPNTTGIQSADQLRSVSLSEGVLSFAQSYLGESGVLLLKIFQGVGFDGFLQTMRRTFKKVTVKKPAASRPQSKEIYLLGVGPTSLHKKMLE